MSSHLDVHDESGNNSTIQKVKSLSSMPAIMVRIMGFDWVITLVMNLASQGFLPTYLDNINAFFL